MDGAALVGVVLILGIIALAMGSGRGRDDLRSRRGWDTSFEVESRRTLHTDATGVLMCRSCGASASERAGRCPACGSAL